MIKDVMFNRAHALQDQDRRTAGADQEWVSVWITRHSDIGLEFLHRRCCWPYVAFEEIDSPRSNGANNGHRRNSLQSTPPRAGTLGNLRQGPQRSVEPPPVWKQVGNFRVKDDNV